MKTIFRSSHRDHFTLLPNALLRDNRLHLKTRGLLALALSHSEEWIVTKKWIEEQVPEGKDSVRTCFRQLEEFGYAVLKETRDETGKIRERIWTFHDSPVPENERSNSTRWKQNPEIGNPPSVSVTTAGNPDGGLPDGGQPETKKEQQEEGTEKEERGPLARIPKELRNQMLELLVELSGWNRAELRKQDWSKVRAGLTNICLSTPDVSPAEIARRAQNFRRVYNWKQLTPLTLGQHWPELGGELQLTPKQIQAEIEPHAAIVRNSPAFPGGPRWHDQATMEQKQRYEAACMAIRKLDPSFNFDSLRR